MRYLGSRGTSLLLHMTLLALWLGFADTRGMARTGSNSVTLTPSSIQFGSVPVGGSASAYETVTNVGTRNIDATGAVVTGAGFSIDGLTFPLILTAGQSITFTVIFAPETSGAASGNVALQSYNSSLNLPLAGTGIAQGQLSVTPANLNFGNVNDGSSSTLNAKLTATGSSVVVTAANVSNPEFAAGGLSFPFTLQAGQSMPFTVTFTPQSGGPATASLSFNDPPNSPTVQSLSGTGVVQPPPSVNLSWNSDGSGGVVGYNIFRGTASGGPYTQINTSTDPNTNYTDTLGSSGTYYYVTTAVNAGGEQSPYSNQVEVVVP